MSRPKIPDFVETYRPRHPVETLRQQLAAPPGLVTLGPPVRSVSTPKTLIELYLGGDIRPIAEDVESRPQHYSAEQRELVEALTQRRSLHPEPTPQRLDDLFLTYHQRTDLAEQRRKIIAAVSRHEPDVADDPEVKAELDAPAATFENQNYDLKILI